MKGCCCLCKARIETGTHCADCRQTLDKIHAVQRKNGGHSAGKGKEWNDQQEARVEAHAKRIEELGLTELDGR